MAKIGGKKLKLKKNYKYTNAKKVKVTKRGIILKVGKSAKIKAKTVRVEKKKKLLPKGHGRKYRYKSTNTNVAKVSKSGKITAKDKGSCSVYVFAQNGYAKRVKVTVK
ncbi:MAG: Ig-like domain-containing protein [Lachnospiraceae bacterium]|nr:Ig-like domain-containing protein [Lachnospiraceae bacterium]